jgi:hypothetical protein
MKLTYTLMASLALGTAAFGQATDHSHHHPATTPQTSKAKGGGMDMKACMKDMALAHEKLVSLVAMMNACQGADRIDATAAVVNQMVANETKMMEMCHSMMSMPGGMMGGGMMGGKGMGGMKMDREKPKPTDHRAHHGG